MKQTNHWRLRLIDSIRGTQIQDTLNQLRSEQYEDTLRLLTKQKLQYDALCKTAISHVPFYASYTPSTLPVVKKEVIRNHPSLFISKAYQGKLQAKGTSGSTGIPLIYKTTPEAQSFMWAGILLSWESAGYLLGDRVAFIAGSALVKKDIKHKVFHSLMNIKNYSAFHLEDSDIQNYLSDMNHSETRLIYGYATALNRVAETILKNGIKPPPALRGIVATAEVLSDQHRKNIENAFQVDVRNQYGCNEGGISAFECEHKNMHLISSGSRIELTPNGDLLSSNLVNKGFVFLRYFTGDRIELKPNESCQCGRGYPLIASVQGRSFDMIIDMNGKSTHSAFFNILFRSDTTVEQFQVHFNEDTLTIYLKVSNGFTIHDIKKKYLDVIRSEMRFRNYVIRLNESFLQADNAKHRYVIDQRKN